VSAGATPRPSSAGAQRVGAIVIGAGAAGLAAAATLRRAGLDVRVLEAGEAPGGVVRSERVGGYLVEHGPNTLRVSGPARAALAELGVEALLVPAAAANRLRFLWDGRRLQPLPTGPLGALTTPLVSLRGKLRIMAEPLVRRGDAAGETVAGFVGRRLGSEAVERLVGPFLTGVYAGDERALAAEAVFPSLVEAERRGGSIVRGLLAARRRRGNLPAALPGIHSCADGLGALPAHLAGELGERLALGTPAADLACEAGGLRVETAHGAAGALWSDRVVLAAPAPAAADLLRPLDARAAELLAGIDHAPLVVSHLGVAATGVRHPLEGFGFLVPRAAGLGLLGCLFLSNLFAGRAPEGRTLLTCMLGGTRWREAVDAPEDLLRAHLLSDLDRTLGLRAEPELLRTVRWPRAVPQPGPDHPRRMAELRARLAALAEPDGARIEPAGAWLGGVSLADTLASGVAAARRLLDR